MYVSKVSYSPALKVVAPVGSAHRADYYTTGTNDHTPIQNAINAVAALSNQGRVLLWPGQYTLGAALSISSSNIEIEGMGFGTELILANSVNPQANISITGTGTVNVKIRRLRIDGNQANQLSGDGIYINTPWSSTDSQHLIEDVEIANVKNNGIETQGDTRQYYLSRVRVKAAQGNGFFLHGTDAHFSDLIADSNLLNGIYINTPAAHVTNCKAFYSANGNSGNYGIYVNSTNIYFVNCETQDNYYDGWYFDTGATNCLVISPIADSNGQTSGSGIRVLGANNSFIAPAGFTRSGVGWTQSIGFSLEGAATGNHIVLPRVYSNTTQYSDTSSGTNYPIQGNGFLPLLATGASHTVDDVITALQNLGLFRQS